LHFGNYASQIRLTLNKLQRKLRFGNALLRARRLCLVREYPHRPPVAARMRRLYRIIECVFAGNLPDFA